MPYLQKHPVAICATLIVFSFALLLIFVNAISTKNDTIEFLMKENIKKDTINKINLSNHIKDSIGMINAVYAPWSPKGVVSTEFMHTNPLKQ